MTSNHDDLWRRIQEIPIDDGPAALPLVRRLYPNRPGKVLSSMLVPRLGAGTQCPVCKDPLKKNLIACPRCMTPQHSECWVYAGGCSTYSCGTRQPNVRRFALPLDPQAPNRLPLYTYPASQALAATLVLVVIVAFGYGLAKGAPGSAVLPKHDNYRPVMVPDRWTPPRPYPTSAQAPASYDVHIPALPSHVDRWGRPIVPDPWGRPVVPDPWGRPSLQDPGGRSSWTRQPGIPRTDLNRGHDPTLTNPWKSPEVVRSYARQPGFPPYGPTPSQHHGFGPSPVPRWDHRK